MPMQADLVRLSEDDTTGVITASIKLDLFVNDPHKVYIIIWQEYDTVQKVGDVNKFVIRYAYKFNLF